MNKMVEQVYDFLIVGGGPTGLALSTMLSQTDATIALIEKDAQLGGCWKVDWVDDAYYSEHSPRVMTTTYSKFKNLLRIYNIKFDYEPVYKDTLAVHKALLSKLSIMDVLKLISGLIISRFFETADTVEDFMRHLSTSGAEAMYTLSVALANIPSKVMMQDVFNEMYSYHGQFVHLKNPYWYDVIETNLSSRVDFRKGFDVQSINEVEGIYIVNTNKGSFKTRELILATPPFALVEILKNSDRVIQNNWGDFNHLTALSLEGSYHSIGFQLHFDKDIMFPKRWCEYCEGDWNIIILPVSNYLDTFTKDTNIKTVWSGCIVDQSKYSKRLGKKVHECTLEEIQHEIMKQLGIPQPTVFTFTEGLKLSNGKYISRDTGFVRSKEGILNSTGNLANLHVVGPVNHKGIVTMETAIHEAYVFVKNRYPAGELHKVLESNPIFSIKNIIFLLLIIFIILHFRS
jgi:hypothetical protein